MKSRKTNIRKIKIIIIFTKKMENKESQTVNIFLSYQWKCQNKVKQLFHELNYYKYFDVFMV